MQGARISHSTIARNYTRNLGRSQVRLNDLNYKATTWQRFSTMAEDTASGVRAMELRRNLARLESHRDNANTALSTIKAAEGQLAHAHELTKNFHEKILQANTGSTAYEDRLIVAQELTRLREQILTVANGRFSDRYLFGGIELTKPAFEYHDSTEVSPAAVQSILDSINTFAGTMTDPQSASIVTAFGNFTSILNGTPVDKSALRGAYNDLKAEIDLVGDPVEKEALLGELKGLVKAIDPPRLTYLGENVETTLNPDSPDFDQAVYDLLKRSYYIDIGLDVKFDAADNVNPSTAYKMSFDGLEIFGEGKDNIILLMDDLIASISKENHDPDATGAMLDKFLDLSGKLNIQVTKIGADTNYLDFMIARMNDEEINLFERQKQVEAIDPEWAIMQYKLQELSYNAALQMGQRVLQPTLWDYVK